nr:MAG TPA: hypothetical protein [Bacteriophage sp.]DAU40952.1 MAG TPA: hypothetical protein [Bacteriophage sp.]
MNPLASMFGQTAGQSTPNLPNNPMQLMQMMGQMKKMVGNRNPDEVINELVSSGRVNQSQLEQAKQMAQQLKGLF